MIRIQNACRFLLFVAATCLVVNDCIRLACSFQGLTLDSSITRDVEEEENNESGLFSFLEEETKHKELMPSGFFESVYENGIKVSIAHLIKDDNVRHLAYMAIFSPPPDLA